MIGLQKQNGVIVDDARDRCRSIDRWRVALRHLLGLDEIGKEVDLGLKSISERSTMRVELLDTVEGRRKVLKLIPRLECVCKERRLHRRVVRNIDHKEARDRVEAVAAGPHMIHLLRKVAPAINERVVEERYIRSRNVVRLEARRVRNLEPRVARDPARVVGRNVRRWIVHMHRP